ncbi:unknown [Bacteroides sp. CAG:598]|nr:unknown [Bacteroides sp. CAG:598]
MGLVREANNISSCVQFSYLFTEFLDRTDKKASRFSQRQFGFQLFSIGNHLGSSQ